MISTPDLVDLLSVIDSGARTREDIFTWPPLPTPHGRSFGGQVLGQAIAAAGSTAPQGREIHSMHGYFVRPGNSEQRMTYAVENVHDGRSFSTRRVQAFQNGEVLMSMISSFQAPEEGLEHSEGYDMSSVAAPEQLPTVWERYGHLAESGRASWMLNRPFDFRHVESDIIFEVQEPVSTQRVWMRTRDDMPEGTPLHSAALAFASDYLMLEPVARRHGIPWATAGMRAASLDHAMWFHRPFRVDEWLLFVLESPTSQSGRGLTHGRFYNRDGELVASVSQESMLRMA